ncbi:uncharacterized protein B0H18DRAFT_1121051 [Fomitopsis serialis]|uniref:uncharacterized protein n=1 Tax=Fomitopsis serialis TaxID=139415 RepID=UPI0020079521|nr:uncharacterized protein B0H18DRAFT_1121051 [Neoantrodia serialis]KAH9922234.1 hypothetical protein B0H18DRAFT_1121051 [Neoantrodia serialis]
MLVAKKAKEDDNKMDLDDEGAPPRKPEWKLDAMSMSPALPEAASSGPEIPLSLKLGMQFAFSVLAHALRKPMRKYSPLDRSTLNPYITVLLTFLATAAKDTQALAAMDRFIPWEDSPRSSPPSRAVSYREQQKERSDRTDLLPSECNPLPEDWCLRGFGSRGFLGPGDEHRGEERRGGRPDKSEGGDQLDGIFEDERGEYEAANEPSKRWARVARAGLKIAKHVGEFAYYPAANEEQKGQWKVEGMLPARWNEDSLDVDDEDGLAAEESTIDSEDDEIDTPDIQALKARRQYLQCLLELSAQGRTSPPIPRCCPRGPQSRKPACPRSSVRVILSYSILVIDTNILLSSLAIKPSLVEHIHKKAYRALIEKPQAVTSTALSSALSSSPMALLTNPVVAGSQVDVLCLPPPNGCRSCRMELWLEKACWRQIACEWYVKAKKAGGNNENTNGNNKGIVQQSQFRRDDKLHT